MYLQVPLGSYPCPRLHSLAVSLQSPVLQLMFKGESHVALVPWTHNCTCPHHRLLWPKSNDHFRIPVGSTTDICIPHKQAAALALVRAYATSVFLPWTILHVNRLMVWILFLFFSFWFWFTALIIIHVQVSGLNISLALELTWILYSLSLLLVTELKGSKELCFAYAAQILGDWRAPPMRIG